MLQDANRILLVEDEVIVALDLQQRLEKMGYQVIGHATTGEEAVGLALSDKPDLILMDIKLHGKSDGIETAARIREKKKIPVIFVTAYSNDPTLKRAREIEAYGYLIKPFEDRELRAAIEIALYKSKMEEKLRLSEERLSLVIQATNDGIWDWNLITDEAYYSPRWKQLLGLPEDYQIDTAGEVLKWVHPEDVEDLKQAINNHLQGLTPGFECEFRILHQDGEYRWMLCRGIALFDEDGKPYRLTGAQSDITSRKLFEEQLAHRALHDELTDLPNRTLFLDRLSITLERSLRPSHTHTAVMFLDLDHFKIINDSLGHLTGDKVLESFAKRIKHCLRPGDTVARLGGDEFAILIDDIDDPGETADIAVRINDEIHKPFIIDGQIIYLSASIGIVTVTKNYLSAEEILRDADTAMYHAKFNGRSRHEFFDAKMREALVHRLETQSELHRALERNEFVLHYQPIFKSDTMEMEGVEALIRWQHPTHGLILPGDFIQIAEETGLIIPIGDWVLKTACQQVKKWHLAGFEHLRISVNLSACQLSDNDLLHKIQSALLESGIPPQFIELELTETTAMQNVQNAILMITQLKQMGVRIAIDDFGSGYSSLDYIKHIPADSIKIDRSFIADLSHDGTAIVSTMIRMAHQLKKDIVAEGVETQEQSTMLNQMGCNKVQGYYYSKAVPPQDIDRLLSGDKD